MPSSNPPWSVILPISVITAGLSHVPQAYVFLREFVLGNNQTGLVNTTDGQIVGGENSILAEDVMPGQSGIYVGSGATQSTYTFPSATIAAWQSYIATATATIVSVPNAPTARSLSPPIPTGK